MIVDPSTGKVRESWTGYQVAWKMARGYAGAFGHKLNAPYVFLPLCAIFLIGLLDWRRSGGSPTSTCSSCSASAPPTSSSTGPRSASRCPSSTRRCSTCFGRALWIGRRGRGEGLRPRWPAAWLLVAALFLIGLPRRAQHGRLGRDRRRLRQRGRGQIASLTANRSTTTSPKTSPRATPTAPSTTSPTFPSSESGPGPAPGTTCPPPTLPRSSSTWPPSPSSFSSARRIRPGPGGQQTGRHPGFRLGRLSVYGLHVALELERHARRAAPRGDLAGARSPRSSGIHDGPRDPRQVRTCRPRPHARDVSAGGPVTAGTPHPLRSLKRPRGRAPLPRHPPEPRLFSPSC